MGVVAEICDRVNVMYLGQIAEQADVDSIFHDPQHPYTEALLGSLPRPDQTVEELQPIAGVMPEAINPPSGCRFHTRCPDAREVCQRVNPEPLDVSDPDEQSHHAACLKHEGTFHAGYPSSPPIENETSSGFDVGRTDARGDRGADARGDGGADARGDGSE